MMISLCRYAGWSSPLLITNPEDRFSRVKAHIVVRPNKNICVKGNATLPKCTGET